MQSRLDDFISYKVYILTEQSHADEQNSSWLCKTQITCGSAN